MHKKYADLHMADMPERVEPGPNFSPSSQGGTPRVQVPELLEAEEPKRVITDEVIQMI